MIDQTDEANLILLAKLLFNSLCIWTKSLSTLCYTFMFSNIEIMFGIIRSISESTKRDLNKSSADAYSDANGSQDCCDV